LKVEVKLHWGLDEGSLETAFNKQIQDCFEADGLGKITLATIKFPDLGYAGKGVEYDLNYIGGGRLELELIEDM